MHSPGFTDDERYIVCELTGYSWGAGRGAQNQTTSWWVADRDYCYREVATFFSGQDAEPPAVRRKRAYALADRLNAEDRAASV